MCPSQEYQRKLHPDDLPLRAQQQRVQRGEQCHFIVRKNPHYPRRRQLLPPIVETKAPAGTVDGPSGALIKNILGPDGDVDENANSPCYVSVYDCEPSQVCKMCRNNFRSCEFCKKAPTNRLTRIPTSENLTSVIGDDSKSSLVLSTSYNPVYNVREIRSVCNSFSALGIDKKLLDVDRGLGVTGCGNATKPNTITAQPNSASIAPEAVNNDPAKGYGSYIYI